MAFTLDQLLDETGISGISGGRMSKKASPAKEDFSKLAERCRRASVATEVEQVEADQLGLAEKTASIAIIAHTLSELRQIADEPYEKTASANFDVETFIKTALEAGHSEESVAAFLEKNALFRQIGTALKEFKHGRTVMRGEQALAKGKGMTEKAFRGLQDLARKTEGLGDIEKAKLISRWRRKFGDDKAHAVLSSLPGGAWSKHPDFKNLASSMTPAAGAGGAAAGPKLAIGMNVGGNQVGLTADQLKKMKTPALAVGAGFLGHRMLSGGGESKSKKGAPVTIINS
jgi:hypothetical protein